MTQQGPRRPRTVYAIAVLAVALAACSGGEDDDARTAAPRSSASAGATPAASASGDVATLPSASAVAVASVPPGATAVPAPGTTTSGIPSATSPSPVSSAPAGPQARRLSATPGDYTLDIKGSSRSSLGEAPIDGEATLTVDPANGEDQHSSLQAGQNGSVEQTVRFTTSAIQLVQLKISSPGFTKEFRPVKPVLLLPQPPTIGRTWSWVIVSTDGATTASLEAKVARTEVVVIGGEKVATTVVHSTLRLTGDITATSVMDTWYSERYHLSVKEHAVTDGKVQEFTFHSDTTTTLRSTKPA